MKKTIQLFLFVLLIFAFLTQPLLAEDVDMREADQGCGVTHLYINEIDYTNGVYDSAEFVELRGVATTRLDGLELHFLNNSSQTPYHTFPLEGKTISSSGYFVMGRIADQVAMLPIESNNTIFWDQDEMISDQLPSAVAIYDTNLKIYCNAVNYGGTVTGLESWLNIGIDTDAHGAGRGCARNGSGWWSCNRLTTPASANDTVAVSLSSADTTLVSSSHALFFSFLFLLWLTHQHRHRPN